MKRANIIHYSLTKSPPHHHHITTTSPPHHRHITTILPLHHRHIITTSPSHHCHITTTSPPHLHVFSQVFTGVFVYTIFIFRGFQHNYKRTSIHGTTLEKWNEINQLFQISQLSNNKSTKIMFSDQN